MVPPAGFELHGRGLLARFSFSMPRSMVGHRDPEAPPVPEHVEAAYTTALADLAQQLHERDDAPADVKFGPAAARAVIELERGIEKRLVGDGDLSDNMREWGGKYAGRVVRLALLLHMAKHGPSAVNTPLTAETVADAVRVGEFFVAHAKAAFGVADTGGTQLTIVESLLTYLRKQHAAAPLRPIDYRTILRSGPKKLRKASELNLALAVLADHNIAIVRLAAGVGRSRRGRVVWLHPDAA